MSRHLSIIAVLLALSLATASWAPESRPFYEQKARNLVFSDLSLGTPQQYEELVGRVRAGDYASAALLLEDVLGGAHVPSQPGRIALGYLWAAAGDHQLALEIFEALGTVPHHFQVPLARALCLHDLGRPAEAAVVFQMVANTSPDPGERLIAAWNCLVDYRDAAAGYIFRPGETAVPEIVYNYQGAYEGLVHLFDYGSREMPRERLLADLAEILARFELYGAAERLWLEALEAPLPADAPAVELSRAYAAVKLADLKRARASYAAATAWLEKALDLAEPGGELHRYAANQLEALRTASQGRIAERLITRAPLEQEELREIDRRLQTLLANPGPAPNLAAAELLLADAGDIERGKVYLEKALGAGENTQRVAALAGEAAYALARLEEYSAAGGLYDLALRAEPDSLRFRLARDLNSIRSHISSGDDEAALEELGRLLTHADPEARLEAAYILLELGRRRAEPELLWRAAAVGGELAEPGRLPLLLAASDAFLLETAREDAGLEELRDLRNRAIVYLAEAMRDALEHQRIEIRIRTGRVFAALATAVDDTDPDIAEDERAKARQAWLRARDAAQAAGDQATVATLDELLAGLAEPVTPE